MSSPFTYADIAHAFFKDDWGKVKPTMREACGNAKPDELTVGALQIILEKVEAVADVATRVLFDRLQKNVRKQVREIESIYCDELKDREKKHGPCPADLRLYLLNDANDRMWKSIGREFAWGDLSRLSRPWNMQHIMRPEEDSPWRKEYDRWMKRKAKKGEK